MKNKIIILISILLTGSVMISCNNAAKQGKFNMTNERMMNATLYQQTAGEVSALYYQAYTLAEIMVRDELTKPVTQKRAIITDIDETLLDNSPYQAKCILQGISYPAQWEEWVESSEAQPLPGALQFFNFVADKGIEIFYITNRKTKYKDATLLNLSRRGFPMADEQHLLMRDEDNSKESRRRSVFVNYRVIMLLGDNLDDFTNVFENKDPEKRKEDVTRLKSSFGRRFIVFPNPMYGSWESAIFNYKQDTTEVAKEDMRRKALKSF